MYRALTAAALIGSIFLIVLFKVFVAGFVEAEYPSPSGDYTIVVSRVPVLRIGTPGNVSTAGYLRLYHKNGALRREVWVKWLPSVTEPVWVKGEVFFVCDSKEISWALD